MENECNTWLKECMDAFSKLKNYRITAEYAKMSPETLYITHGSSRITRDIDPETVLLKGDASVTIIEKRNKKFRIDLNQNIRKIRNPLLRKQVVTHMLISALVRIESKRMITKRKEGERRKNKRMPKKEFDEIFLEKYNGMRARSRLPPIANMANIDAAIRKILSEIRFD
ncbi:MAG: hypothetical protein V1718_04255 [archaeon]